MPAISSRRARAREAQWCSLLSAAHTHVQASAGLARMILQLQQDVGTHASCYGGREQGVCGWREDGWCLRRAAGGRVGGVAGVGRSVGCGGA
eukprot:2344490-Prymnesium_polylepis.1